jgi:hypothetical protein
MRLLERSGIALGILLLVALPTALHGWPTTLRGNLFILVVLSAGLALKWWRSYPRAAPYPDIERAAEERGAFLGAGHAGVEVGGPVDRSVNSGRGSPASCTTSSVMRSA